MSILNYIISVLFLFISSLSLYGQNLTTNPYFNDTSGKYPAISFNSSVAYFLGWNPHYSLNDSVNVPWAGMSLGGSSGIYLPGVGHNPMPHSGIGYGLLMFTSNATTREQLYGNTSNVNEVSLHINTLKTTLTKDTNYCVEGMFRAWNGRMGQLYSCDAHDKLGFYFSNRDSLSSAEPWRDGIVPQVFNNTGYLDNLDEWRKVKGDFIANGDERFLFVGNFDPFNGPNIPLPVSFSPCNPYFGSVLLFDAVMVYNCNDTVFNITLKDTTVCHGQQVTLLPAVGGFKLDDTVTTYNWYTPMGTFLAADTFFVATQPGKYTLEVVINKRFKAMQSIEVKWMAPKPDVQFLPDTVLLCRDKTISLFAPYIDSAQYSWSNGDTDTLTHISWPGQYTLNITHPCWQHTETVEAMPVNCQEIFIPNAFTPDGNGTNDFFEIRGLHEYNGLPITLVVTDRWGKVVYSSTNYKNTWDGTYNGQPLEAAVYTYRIIYNKVAGGINYEKYGSVTIIR